GTPDNSYAILNVGEKTPIATPCYICQGGGYVCYSGSDTFDKRKKAKKEHKCNVKGTSTCSSINCNGKYVINQ
ncbi:MAG: hypothetical protein OEV44_02240, partial [Spirochaetota bacterium]|nr:hypothetical protein [Spirochaetota bacterium]